MDQSFRIHKISPTGTHVGVWGSKGSGDGQFNGPDGIALDASGNMYVTEMNGYNLIPPRLQKFDSNGTFIKSFSTWSTGFLSSPYDVALDSSGNIYIVNNGSNQIIKLNADMSYNTSWTTQSNPSSIFIDNDKIYVGQMYGTMVNIYNTTGTLQSSFNTSETSIYAITKDSSGNFYIGAGSKIIKYDANLNETYKWTINSIPYGIVVDSSGTIYTTGDNRIIKSRIVSTNNYLSSLTVTGQTLAFDKNINDYTLNMGSETTSVDITATTEDGRAAITLNGTTVASGTTQTCVLGLGENVITYVVTADSGSQKTYKVTINVATPANTILVRPPQESCWDVTSTYYEDYNWISGVNMTYSEAAFKFDITELAGKTITGAKFYTKNDVNQTTGSMSYDLCGSNDNSWLEGTSFPAPAGEYVTIISDQSDTGIDWQIFNNDSLKDFIANRYSSQSSSPRYCTLIIKPTSDGSADDSYVAHYNSHATTANQPYLLISYSYTLPTTQASSVTFNNVTSAGMTINWTNGNGASRAVFVKDGSGDITNPSDSTTYTASADWSSKGTQLGTSGYYCVYNGTGSSVGLTNLSPGTAYSVQVFEYNGSAGSERYLTTTATGNPNAQTTQASPTYIIEAIGNQTLKEVVIGYTSGTQETREVMITRSGTGDLANLQVALSGDNADSFTITQPPATTLNSATPTTKFTIKANDGLVEGTYSATVTVSATLMTDVTFTVTQVVQQGKTDECFIATAAFGSKFDWPVMLLRHFRDQYMLTNPLGTAFVKFYYQNSPPIAAMIASSQPLKILVRLLLAPVIAGVYLIYHPVILEAALFLLIAFLAVRRLRLRRRYI